MAKKKLYAYDSYSDKDQERHPANKTLMQKVFPTPGISTKDNATPPPKSSAGKGDRQNDPTSPMKRYNDAAAKQGNFFSAKRLKKGK